MLYDEERYPDPHHFNPERFFTDDGQLDPTVLDPASVAFGFGRRSVSGLCVEGALGADILLRH